MKNNNKKNIKKIKKVNKKSIKQTGGTEGTAGNLSTVASDLEAIATYTVKSLETLADVAYQVTELTVDAGIEFPSGV